MLINLSNHPSSIWSEKQLLAAFPFGEILDIPFPCIPPDWETEQVEHCALDYFEKIRAIAQKSDESPIIHIAGEPVFCFILIQLLLKNRFSCITSTTERIVTVKEGTKVSEFKFNQFRRFKIIEL